MCILGFNKKSDLKNINEVNQELKRVYDKVYLLENGLVVGDNAVEIGIHFSQINDPSTGFDKVKPEQKILVYDTKYLFNTIKDNKKRIDSISLERDSVSFYDSDANEPLLIGNFVTLLPKKYRDTVEVIESNLEKLTNGIRLDEDTIHTIYKNKHFVIIPTEIEDVRVSKQLMPAIKSTTKELSDVYIYTIPAENKHMFKVIFKVVNEYVTHYHIYMVIRKEEQ